MAPDDDDFDSPVLNTPGRPSWIGLSPLRDPLRDPHAVWKGIMRIARPFVPSIPDIPDDFAKGAGGPSDPKANRRHGPVLGRVSGWCSPVISSTPRGPGAGRRIIGPASGRPAARSGR